MSDHRMMGVSVRSANHQGVALVTIDDGDANYVTSDLLSELATVFDEVVADEAGAVVLAGREGVFSAGFDPGTLSLGDDRALLALVTDAGDFVARLYESPVPIVGACGGDAIGAGALLLIGAHYRVGSDGPFRIALIDQNNPTVLPSWAVELSRLRLSARHVDRAAIESAVYTPDAASHAGFIDQLVGANELLDAALEKAQRLASLPPGVYASNARKVRAPGLVRIRACLEADRAALSGRD